MHLDCILMFVFKGTVKNAQTYYMAPLSIEWILSKLQSCSVRHT